jgi:hypothetical protein
VSSTRVRHTLDDATAAALASAAEWRLMGLLLERPHADWRHLVGRLGEEVSDRDLRRAVETVGDASEGFYLALLGPGGDVPSRLVGYRRFSDPGWVLSDLARFYDAFAFRAESEDPPDHVAVALQFVSYLFLKEAFARGCGDTDAMAVTVSARDRFIEEHLQPVVHPLANRLAPIAPEYLVMTTRALAARVAVPLPEPASLAGIKEDEGDLAMCGSCAARPID